MKTTSTLSVSFKKGYSLKKLFLSLNIFALLILLNLNANADNITPVRTDVSGFTDWTDVSVLGTTYPYMLVATASMISPVMNFDNYTGEALNFKARTYGGTNVAENTITVWISTDNGSNWTNLGTRVPATSTLTAMTAFDLSSYSGTQVKIKFTVAGTNSSIGAGLDDITITGTPGAPSPTITLSESALTGFTYIVGAGPSGEQTFTVAGTNLTSDISLAASTNYEISKTSGSGYTSPLTFTPSSGTVTATTVYVRLKTGLSINTYNGETLTATATSATNQTVTCSGEVTAAPSPTITLSESTLTGFTYVEGAGPSAEQTFTVSGTNLTADISLSASTNYEISKTSGSGYTSPLTFTQSGGTVNATTVYVRLKAGLSVNTYNAETLTASSTGATNQTVSCSGEVTAPSASCASDLIISQVNENGSDKYVEIANLTGSSVSLSNYDLVVYSNGSVTVSITIDLNDAVSIADGDVYILANTNLSITADQTSGSFTPNGNDVIALRKASSNIDVFGTIGVSTDWYADLQFIRNSNITAPTTSYSASDWTITAYGGGDPGSLGAHSMSCSVCATPSNQPTSLTFPSKTYNSINGSFTAASGATAAHGYLVVRSTASSLSATPTDGVSYTAGDALGGGVVVSMSASTTFTASGLSQSTQYYFFVFSYENINCSGGPLYLTSSPLTGNETTPAGPAISITGTVDAFGNVCVGSLGTEDSYSISGSNLTGNIVITAPAGFKISLASDGANASPITLTQSGGTVNSTTIYVNYAPSSAGASSGNITNVVSADGLSQNISVSGTGIAIPSITGTTPGSVCISGTVNLGATASAGTINWYTASSGGASQGTGTSFTTPSISSNTTYWVDATDNGCVTASRTSVLASIDVPVNVTSPSAGVGNTTSTLTWTNPASCYDEIMIAVATASNTGSPSGDGSSYTANLAYGSGTLLGNGRVVYKGSTSSQVVTGLTNGVTYYVKFWTRKGTTWSAGTEATVVPAVTVFNIIDDYDGIDDKTYTTNDVFARNTGTNVYENSPTASTPNNTYASYDLSASLSGWNLNKINLNKWCGWMDFARTSVSGWDASENSIGMVLACNNSNFMDATAAGYAVIYKNGTPDNLVLVKFSAGFAVDNVDIPSGATVVATSSYAYTDSDNGVNFFVELLSDGTWKLSWLGGAQLSAANAQVQSNYTGGSVTSANDETYSGSTYKYAGWLHSHSSTDKAWFDNLGAGFTPASAILAVTPTSLSGLGYNFGGSSTPQSFALSGTDLSGADVIVTAPTNFQVSLSSGSGFANSLTLSAFDGTSTTIWVKLNSSLGTGDYSGNVTCSGGGAPDSKTVAVSGTVVKGEPTNNPSAFSCGTGTTSSLPLTWTDASAGTLPDGYLIKWSNTSYAAITDPVDGTTVADSPGSASGSLNVAQGVGTGDATSLSQGTQYYFKIWSYTNTGSNINYKIGSALTSTCATLDAPCEATSFEGGLPAGWSATSSFLNNATFAHTGTWSEFFNDAGDALRSTLETNPQSVSFWLKTDCGAGESFGLQVQTSPDQYFDVPANIVTKATYTALPSDAGDIKSTYTNFNVTLGVSGNQYVRFIATTEVGAVNIYIDDVDIYCNNLTPGVSIVTSDRVVGTGNVEQNSTNNIIYKVKITSAITYAALQSAAFHLSGNYTSSTLTASPFKLWFSATDNFGSATQIGTTQSFVATGGTVTFSSLNTSIVGGSTGDGFLWLTADIACASLTGKTISVDAANNTDFTFTLANFNTTGPYDAGGTQTTIAASTVANVTGANATDENTASSTITWTAPACFDDLIIVASTSTISFTPSGTSYSGASLVYGAGTAVAAGVYLIYSGSTSSQIMTGLAAGTYYVKIFTRKGSVWSAGVETTAVVTAKAEPSEHPTNFSCGSTTASSMVLTWTDAGGAVVSDGYLIKWSDVDYGSISATADGNTYSGNAVTVAQGIQTYTVTGLDPQTTYYFKIWAYTNSGASTDYKTDGTILTSSCFTLPLACLTADFSSGLPAGWAQTSVTFSGYADFSQNTGSLSTSVISEPALLQFDLSRSSNTTAKTLYVEVSTTTQGGTYTTVATYTNANTTSDGTTACTVDLSAYSGETTVYLRFRKESLTTSYWRIDNVAVTCGACEEPTTNPTGLVFSNETNTSVDFTITNPGSGTNRIIVARPSSAVNFTPTDHIAYASTDYETGVDLGSGNKVVYNNTGSSGTISGLTPGTTYYFAVYEYKCANPNQDYKISGTILTGNATTKISPVTNLSVVCQTSSTATIEWIAPVGAYDGVIIAVGTSTPGDLAGTENESSYTANSTYPSGTTIGTTGKTVYKGTGTTVTVSGLTAGQAYEIKAYTFKNSTTWSGTFPTASIASLGTPNVSSLSATPQSASVQVTWVNPSSGCFDEVLVFAKTTCVTASPSGDGSTYTPADADFTGSGYSFDGGKLVYKGTSNSVTVSGLTNGTSYCFKVFTRTGTAWSTGVTVSATPIEGVYEFVPGSIAVLGVCSQIQDCAGGYSNGDDEISIVSFGDLTTGSTFDMTDNGWERCTPGYWGNAEGYMRIRRTGSTIPKGTVITFRLTANAPYFEGIYPDADWTVDINVGSLILNTAGDQIYFMTGGTWNNGTVGNNNATYVGGTFLFAFNTNDAWTAGICSADNNASGDGRSQNSGLYPNMDCFNMMPGAATDYVKLVYDIASSAPKSQREWIEIIKDPANWEKLDDCNDYYNGAVNNFTASETSIPINTSGSTIGVQEGLWTGAGGESWFNCLNWDNMIIPDETVDVLLPATGTFNHCKIDDPITYGFTEASCNNLTNELATPFEFFINNANSKLDIYGDFSNDAVFNHTAGLVTFKGAAAQAISGTNAISFYNLTINNSSTGVTLNRDVTTSNILTFTDGKIITSGSSILNISNTATTSIVGGVTSGTEKYVEGKLQWNTVAGTYTFPVGYSGYGAQGFGITVNSGNGNVLGFLEPYSYAPIEANAYCDFEIRTATNQNAGDGTCGTDGILDQITFNVHSPIQWDISNPSGGTISNYDLTVYPNGAQDISSSVATTACGYEVKFLMKNGEPGNTGTTSSISGTPFSGTGMGICPSAGTHNSLTGLTGFSKFNHHGASKASTALPVELLYFDAVRDGKIVNVNWGTATERNNDYFTVERSRDAKEFDFVTNYPGAGNSLVPLNYSIVDYTPFTDKSYYRLKQTDFDGAYSYSKIVAVDGEKNKGENDNISIVKVENAIQISIENSEASSYYVEIIDVLGRVLFKEKYFSLSNKIMIDIDDRNFSTGLYNVAVFNENVINTKKLLIK